MAQRTGAERFLASAARTASARFLLALAVAASLLAGCGEAGDSSDPETTATSGEAAAARGAPEGTVASATGESGPEGRKSSGSSPDGPGSGSGASSSGQAKGGAGQKQGPRIAAPKGPTEQAPTSAQIAQATVADISLRSPAIVASAGNPGTLPATYTCDGEDSWPELRWSGVPAGSAELILYAMSLQPVNGKLFVDWAVAGLDPGLDSVKAGELPRGAIVGTNGFGERGYSICPTGSGEIYMFALYALPTSLSPRKGFDARELRKEILDVSGNVGLLPALYARG